MKIILIILVTSLSLIATASTSKLAQKLLVNHIERYAEDYGVIDLFTIVDHGQVNNKYSFTVKYSMQFCRDTGDDERATCAEFSCASPATVDADGVVEFETETSQKSCLEIPDTETTKPY
jgi:hypothetical protein